jgi:hypothetical protein
MPTDDILVQIHRESSQRTILLVVASYDNLVADLKKQNKSFSKGN